MYDRARIFVQAGAGGDGIVSFRREAHVPKGGPDGGDGGHGGDVVLVCDASRRDLQEFHRGARKLARPGGKGEGSQRHGATAPALEIRVPPGTVVDDAERGVHWDLVKPGQRAVVARGGQGGRGNKTFASSTRQTPRMAERGLAGEEGWLDLHLKLLADAGLVGLPNAGKSSLIARITNARPKVANYPFTTLEPALGTIQTDDRQLVLADIPGLIEGASSGAGLGHEFLAHIERCRLLVHVLDVAPLDGSDPVINHALVEEELREHDAGLELLPRILCLSKSDLLPLEVVEEAIEAWRERMGDGALAVLATSSATGAGLSELVAEIVRAVPEDDVEGGPAIVEAEHRVYRPGLEDAFEVERIGEEAFRVSGRGVERLLARHDIDNEEALRYIEHQLDRMGVIRALRAAGFESGNDVEISGVLFEFDPGPPLR